LRDIEKLNLPTLRTAFWMIPNKTNNNDHKTIVKAVISAFKYLFFKSIPDKPEIIIGV
jgi:hypothetical protein